MVTTPAVPHQSEFPNRVVNGHVGEIRLHTTTVPDMLHPGEGRIGEPTKVGAAALYALLLRGSKDG
jgi:hypothetical protein